MSESEQRIEGLVAAVEVSPTNHPLRLVLAETLHSVGRVDEALDHYAKLAEEDEVPRQSLAEVGSLALGVGRLALAGKLLEHAKHLGLVDGVAGLQAGLEKELGTRPEPGAGPEGGRAVIRSSAPGSESDESGFAPGDLFERDARTTFDDVGGLDEVKKTIHRTIILPFQRPDLYLKYGRSAGGGVMLYGPPGCGKTLLARATAGEAGLPFFNVRIEEILDPYMGISEQNLHAVFEEARANAPCVLFIDELDALAYARRKQAGSAGRPLVDLLLQELDAIGSDNAGLLILSATNAPWDVDDALKRPGRLDRPTFVPPPDEKARRTILELLLRERHAEKIDVKGLAKETPLHSGADLRALVETAIDLVIDEALGSGTEPPLAQKHLESARARVRPSVLDWLASARNYVEFANQAGQYDEVQKFLKSREARRLKEFQGE